MAARFDRDSLLLYAITDGAKKSDEELLAQVEGAILGGATMVQLREKSLGDAALLARAKKLSALCHRLGVPLIINDRADIALSSGADGVHVGAGDAPVSDIRRDAGDALIIGATAKTVSQARAAEAAGADYLGVGALFPSPTKQDAVRVTPEDLRSICESVSIPSVAIGGITAERMALLRGCGMAGFAVVSAIFGAGDARQAARGLREAAERACSRKEDI